jgi:hypothetical protein
MLSGTTSRNNIIIGGEIGFAGYNQLVPAVSHELAQNLFGSAFFIYIGTVEKVDAYIPARLEHFGRFLLICRTAEGHGAQTQLRYLNTCFT